MTWWISFYDFCNFFYFNEFLILLHHQRIHVYIFCFWGTLYLPKTRFLCFIREMKMIGTLNVNPSNNYNCSWQKSAKQSFFMASSSIGNVDDVYTLKQKKTHHACNMIFLCKNSLYRAHFEPVFLWIVQTPEICKFLKLAIWYLQA